ncbi:hypothetical protein [Sphingobium sp. MK2]|uniref:hypothetical protein n=1 Tax=Sphingobium sp. MK2 TaxID=3116540 RepID=UPI0032E35EA4
MNSETVTNEQADDPCICHGVVPKEKRIDFDQFLLHEKSGKRKWKTVLRYHKDCPEHGVKQCHAD